MKRFSHQIEDMLIGCYWKWSPCNADNFTQVLTDGGFCYTFNNPTNHSQILQSNAPGNRHGLFLKLDTESHEYTQKESSSAGLKV